MLAYSLFFSFLAIGTFSCTEDANDLSDFSNDNQELVERGIIGNNHNDDIDYRPKPDYENDPYACKCFMRINDISYTSGIGGTPDLMTFAYNHSFGNNPTFWNGFQTSLPSDWLELPTPAGGITFSLEAANQNETSDLTVNTTVECWFYPYISSIPATTTNHSFVWHEGTPTFPNSPGAEFSRTFLPKSFGCVYQTAPQPLGL